MKLPLAALSIFCMSTFFVANATRAQQAARPGGTPVARAKPTPEIFAALPNYDEETATRLQIFLDNSDFGPGKIDGKMGEFFRKALISYKHAHLARETGFVDQWLLDQVPVTFTTYTIKPDDLKVHRARSNQPLRASEVESAPFTDRFLNLSWNAIIPLRRTFRN